MQICAQSASATRELARGAALFRIFSALTLAIACSALFGCAKKHNTTSRTAPARTPRIQSGETGLASWYGRPYHGRQAANGEIYDMEKLTAAHRTLPFGTWVRVTNLTNEKTVEVRITDRGPFVDGRIIDLSHAAAEAIDLIGPGVARVRLDIVSTPQMAAVESWYAVQAAAFREKETADSLRMSMQKEYGSARLVLRPGNPVMWRVLVGKESSEEAANGLAERVRKETGDAFVVRLDEVGSGSGR